MLIRVVIIPFFFSFSKTTAGRLMCGRKRSQIRCQNFFRQPFCHIRREVTGLGRNGGEQRKREGTTAAASSLKAKDPCCDRGSPLIDEAENYCDKNHKKAVHQHHHVPLPQSSNPLPQLPLLLLLLLLCCRCCLCWFTVRAPPPPSRLVLHLYLRFSVVRLRLSLLLCRCAARLIIFFFLPPSFSPTLLLSFTFSSSSTLNHIVLPLHTFKEKSLLFIPSNKRPYCYPAIVVVVTTIVATSYSHTA